MAITMAFTKEKNEECLFNVWRMFSLDLRSLALFRILISFISLIDLSERCSTLTIFYTDYGLVPITEAIYDVMPESWCFHMMSGGILITVLLFVFHILVVCSLLVGYRTRLSTFLAWLMLRSLHNRNKIVLNGGDDYLCVVLLWSCFLPLGDCYSLDNFLSHKRGYTMHSNKRQWGNAVVSIGSAAFLIQIGLMYWTSVLLKTGIEWRDGTAVYFALSIDQFARPLAYWVLHLPEWTLKALTHFTIYIELVAPLLLVCPLLPSLSRLLGISLIVGMHMGFGSCLNIGLFMWIPQVVVVATLPPFFWKYWSWSCGFEEETPLGTLLVRGYGRLQAIRLLAYLLVPVTDANKLVQPLQIDNQRLLMKHDGCNVFWRPTRRGIGKDGDEPTALLAGYIAMHQFAKCFPVTRWAIDVVVNAFGYVEDKGLRIGVMLEALLVQSMPAINPTAANGRLRCFRVPMMCHVVFQGYTVYCDMSIHDETRMQALALVLLLYVVSWNLQSAGLQYRLPEPLHWVGPTVGLEQHWNLFAPCPLTHDGWYVFAASLQDGQMVDAWTGRLLSYSKPRRVSTMYPSQRWRKYMMTLYTEPRSNKRQILVAWLCKRWNQEGWGVQHGFAANNTMRTVRMEYVLEETLPFNQVLQHRPDLLHRDFQCI